MWEKKRTYTFTHSNSAPASPFQARYARTFRNLPRDQLGGVIFGCTNATIRECLEKQLVGQLFGPNILSFNKKKSG